MAEEIITSTNVETATDHEYNAVSYTHLAAIERAALDVVQNDPVGLRVGIGDPAFDRVVHGCIRQKAEGLKFTVRVAGLAFQLGEVDASPVEMCIRDSTRSVTG